MVTSCFFCQNLLSDYVEGLLPSSRHQELNSHLEGCETCAAELRELELTRAVLKRTQVPALSHELALRIIQASESGRVKLWNPRRYSQVALLVGLPIVIILAVSMAFPNLLPFSSWIAGTSDDSQYARYFPLLQGANDILDEQTAWLGSRDSLMGSVWEEGGLSPEDFEKTFQLKNIE